MNIICEDESTYIQAVTLAENLFGKLDIKVAAALADLADFYAAHGKYDNAEACDSRIRTILENWCGPGACTVQPVPLSV